MNETIEKLAKKHFELWKRSFAVTVDKAIADAITEFAKDRPYIEKIDAAIAGKRLEHLTGFGNWENLSYNLNGISFQEMLSSSIRVKSEPVTTLRKQSLLDSTNPVYLLRHINKLIERVNELERKNG